MSGVLNDCDALLQAAPVRVIPSGLAAQVQEALDAASAAQEDADNALVLLADIASDNKLTPSEKPDLVAKRDAITAEQAGIEAQATSLGVSTEKTAYTAAITALTNYLASAPMNGWNTIPGSTISITGADLRAKFADVYTKRQALLNANTSAAAARAVWANISGTGKPEDGATVGAPAGTTVNGVPVANITAAVTNFNAGNDRNSAALVIPTIATDGSAVDHTIRKDGGADISLEWLWAGAEGDIDGFLVYVYQSTSSFAYTFGSTPALEAVYTVPANKRAFILFGSAADLYTTFGVQAYRSVDKDVNSTGAIKSPLVKPSLAAENPYRPQANIAFGGDITGTVNGTAVATLLANAAAGKAASDSIAVISDDNVLSKGEKPEAILKWNTVVSEYSALQAQANSLGVSRTAYDTAYTALSSYLTSINSAPAWTDVLVDTPIAGTTFRTKFLDYYTAKQALLNAIAAKSATVAQWSGVVGPGKPVDNASSDVTLVATSGMTVTGNRAVRAGGDGEYWQSVHSRDSYTGGAYASVRVDNVTDVVFGLSTNPGQDPNPQSIHYGIRINGDGTTWVFNGANWVGDLGTWAVGDVLAVLYDGTAVRYVKNGSVLWAIYVSITSALFFDSTFRWVGSEVSAIRFGPMSSNNWGAIGGSGKPQDNATVGAPAGTNVGSTPATTVEANANNAVKPPSFSVTGTFGGSASNPSTSMQTLSRALSASVSGNPNPVTITWEATNIDANVPIKLSSNTGTSVTVSATAANVGITIAIKCTVTDDVTGVSIIRTGLVNLRFGNV